MQTEDYREGVGDVHFTVLLPAGSPGRGTLHHSHSLLVKQGIDAAEHLYIVQISVFSNNELEYHSALDA